MFKRLGRGLRHSLALLLALPVSSRRRLLRRMIRLSRSLPGRFARPLPDMLADLTPPLQPGPVSPDGIRVLADAVAVWHLRSPLGLCLRRSLLRYYFLREAGLPVCLVFGARLKSPAEGAGLGGHAWLTLDGRPYYERPEDMAGFVEMVRYPEGESASQRVGERVNGEW